MNVNTTPEIVTQLSSIINTIVGRNTTRIQRNRDCNDLLNTLIKMKTSSIFVVNIDPFTIEAPMVNGERVISISSSTLVYEKIIFSHNDEGYMLNGTHVATNSLIVLIVSFMLRSTKEDDVEIVINK